MKDDVIVINEGLESKTSKSGETRFHVKITAEPLVISTNPKDLGAPVANAIAHHLRERMRGISEVASPATIKAREVAKRALARGEAWAVKRYGGGKLGLMQPGMSDRKFNDSGRMAKSIVATAARDNSWRVNVAANRLDPQTTDGGAGVQRIWTELVRLVPEFADATRLMASDIIRKTMERQAGELVKKARATSGKLGLDVARGLFRAAQKFAGTLGELAA